MLGKVSGLTHSFANLKSNMESLEGMMLTSSHITAHFRSQLEKLSKTGSENFTSSSLLTVDVKQGANTRKVKYLLQHEMLHYLVWRPEDGATCK